MIIFQKKNQTRRCSLNLRKNYFENMNKMDDETNRTSKDFESIDDKLKDLNLDTIDKKQSIINNNNPNIKAFNNTNKFLIDYPKPFINKNDALITKKDKNNNYNENLDTNRNNELLTSSL